MKTLYLLRHATAAAATPPAMSDFDRTLTGLGVREAHSVGRYMQINRFVPAFIHSSAAVRTSETAQIAMHHIFGNAAPCPSNFDKELYNMPEETLLAAVQAASNDHRSLLLVAHNQGIGDLAFTLGKVSHYEPGTLSVFTAACDTWAEFSAQTSKLEKVFSPEG
jgi:phosphohistidine phosphatase